MRRKGGDRCILPNCLRGYRNCENVRLFNFPLSDAQRQVWAAKCHLNKFEVKFHTARICERHFAPKWLGKKFLKRGAVPSLHLPPAGNADGIKFKSPETNQVWQQMNPPEEPTPNSCSSDDVCIVSEAEPTPAPKAKKSKKLAPYCNGKVHTKGSEPCNAHINDPDPICYNCIKFYELIQVSERQLEKKCKELEMFRAKYKAILQKYKLVNLQIGKEKRFRLNTLVPSRRRKMHQILDNAKHLNANTKSVCAMLMKTTTTWREDEKNIAQRMFNFSPSSYNFMRNKLDLHLPSKRCIERWNMTTGFKKEEKILLPEDEDDGDEEGDEEDEANVDYIDEVWNEEDEEQLEVLEEEDDEEEEEAAVQEGETPETETVKQISTPQLGEEVYAYAIEVYEDKVEYPESDYETIEYEELDAEALQMLEDGTTEILEIDPDKLESEEANYVEIDEDMELEVLYE